MFSNKFAKLFLFILLLTVVSTLSMDFYNTLNVRRFLDIFFGIPGASIRNQTITFSSFTWSVDWPYPPLTIVLTGIPWFIYNNILKNEIIYQLLFKLPMLFSYLATALVIHKITGSSSLFYKYLFNPGVIIITAIWGSFDLITGLLILASVYLIKSRPSYSILLLSLSVALRVFPIVIAPILLSEIYLGKNKLSNRSFKISASNIKRVIFYVLLLLSFPLLSLVILNFGNKDFFYEMVVKQQQNLGPIGSFPFLIGIQMVVNKIFNISIDIKTLAGMSFFILIPLLLGIYYHHFKKHLDTKTASIVGLLIFFAIYPKMHAPYIFSVLPLILVSGSVKVFDILWIPSFLYAIFINGKEHVRGIFYWFYWLVGDIYKTEYVAVILMTVGISVAYEVSIIYSISKYLTIRNVHHIASRKHSW